MRILFIGVGFRPFFGGGMIIYVEDLMAALAAAGHHVTQFVATRHNLLSVPHLRRTRADGIDRIELWNSPALTHNDPDRQCRDATVEALTRRVVGEIRPDVAHISDLRAHSLSVVGVLKDMGVPVVKMMHNYWDLCPQTHLQDVTGRHCSDYQDGRGCVACGEHASPVRVRLKDRVRGTFLQTPWYPVIKATSNAVRAAAGRSSSTVPPTNGTAVAVPSPDAFARRRRYAISQLNQLDAFVFQSRRSAEIFAEHGIPRDRFKVVPIVSVTSDNLRPKPLRDDRSPVVFGYRGSVNREKGVHLLVDAIKKFDRDRVRLLIYGSGDPVFEAHLRAESSGWPIEFRGPYAPEELGRVNETIDVGVLPSIWADVFPYVGVEYVASRIPVLGSNRGGIQEYIEHGRTGFVFDPDDPASLTDAMAQFVDDPSLIRRMQEQIRPWKTMRAHADEMLAVYREVIERRGRPSE